MDKKNNEVAEIIRKATAQKPVRVPVASVEIDPTRNVREPDIATWGIPELAEDIAQDGQKEPAMLEKIGDKYFPLRGFRRCSAIKVNAAEKKIDPATGKIFDSVLAFVVSEELSERQRLALLSDVGNTRILNKVELFYLVERLDKVYDTDAEVSISARGLLDLHFPVKREVESEADYAEMRRGAIANLLTPARSPLVLRDAYVRKIKKEQSWPSDKEVAMLFRAFKKEMDADKTRKITRLNPGPDFRKQWDEFVAKKTKDGNERRPKSAAQKSRDDLTTAQSHFDSRMAKLFVDWVLNNGSGDIGSTLDSLWADLEAGKTITAEQIGSILDGLVPDEKE